MSTRANPSGNELFFDRDEIIVSKTNPKGHITYANETFVRLAGFKEKEILGQPHNLIRHPDMPRSVFKLLWDTIQEKREIFAYVVNMAKNGDHYWVLAHVTPSYDAAGNITSFHSNRRVPNRETLHDVIIPLYEKLSQEEMRHGNRKEGLAHSTAMLSGILEEKGMSYEEFIFSV